MSIQKNKILKEIENTKVQLARLEKQLQRIDGIRKYRVVFEVETNVYDWSDCDSVSNLLYTHLEDNIEGIKAETNCLTDPDDKLTLVSVSELTEIHD